MSTRRIVYTRPDGSLTVRIPAPEFVARFKTEEEALAAIIARDVPADAINVIQCDASDIPADRSFRDAWERGASPVVVNMTKARAIQMGRIRAARDEKIQTLDGPWMRATGQGDTPAAAAIEAERQALRDIPQTFDLTGAATPDELKVLWPAILP